MAEIAESVAQEILAIFGITSNSRAYDRWLKDGGFSVEDFEDVLSESIYLIGVDWRSDIEEPLRYLSKAMSELGYELNYECNEELTDAVVSCGGKTVHVHYDPIEDADFSVQMAKINEISPDDLEIRFDTTCEGSDSWNYGLLTEEEWGVLESLHESLKGRFVGIAGSD